MGPSSSISPRFLSLFIFIVTFPGVLSLHVVPGSNCTALCSFRKPITNTTSNEITCKDKDYESTVGKTFEDCVSCEFQSKSFDHGTGQTDVGWGLYNMRYALDWCLFGVAASTKDASVAGCDEVCQPTKEGLEVNAANSTAVTPYGYCEDLDSVAFANCARCYAKSSDHDYLSNYLNLLSSACEWQITPPTDFPIAGSQVFTHKPPSNYSTAGPNSRGSSGLTNQSKLAIGIAIPVFLLLVLGGLLLFWYFQLHLPGKTPASQPFEPDFRLYKRQGEKGTPTPTTSSWHSNPPTIYHPTPALHHTPRYPPHLRLQPARLGRPGPPNIKLETSAIMAAQSTRYYSPPRVTGHSPTSTQHTGMTYELEANAKRKSTVPSDVRGKTGKKEKRAKKGGKDAAGAEDLFS